MEGVLSAPRAVPGRLYRDETGAYWIGTEDGRYAQASRDGYTVLPHYLHHFIDVDAQIRRSNASVRAAAPEVSH